MPKVPKVPRVPNVPRVLGVPRARRHLIGRLTGCALAVVVSITTFAQPAPQTYRGLEISVTGVTRATNVSLTDCPAGANTVRGVIKPGDVNEFVSVAVSFKVLPAFKPSTLPKPVLTSADGKTYNTAQSFGEVGSEQTFSCIFSFRVPVGSKVTKFSIDTVSVDIGALGK